MSAMKKSNDQELVESQAPIVMELLPSMPALLGKVAFKSGHYQIGDPLPGLSTQVSALHINPEHLHSYQELCGFEASAKLPATYLHMLAFPLFLNILIQNIGILVKGILIGMKMFGQGMHIKKICLT